MKQRLIFLMSLVSAICISQTTFAEDYYQDQPSGGYSTSANSPDQPTQHRDSHERYDRKRDRFSISVNLGNQPVYSNPPVVVAPAYSNRHHHRYGNTQWVGLIRGDQLPNEVVVGGAEANGELVVCRGNYQGGVHPGKLVGTSCNIAWGGNEVVLSRYQVLVSPYPLNWANGSNGYIPRNAIRGGNENNGAPIYICQAQYQNGMHPGKLVGRGCHIAWGGQEIEIPYYNVLVR